MNKYRKYKPSNIEWIGDIPEHWEVEKLRYIGNFTSSGIDKKINEDEPFVKIINYTDVYGNTTRLLTSERNYMEVSCPEEKRVEHQVKKGDLVFTPSSETIEDIGLSALVDEDLENTAYSYHVLRFRFDKEVDHSFKKYLCNNYFILNQFSANAKGTTRKILNRENFNSALVILPPESEQHAIANFLDAKTAQIDKLITNKQILIEILKEERMAVIDEAVTKGVNTNIKLKQSGYDWLGKIPQHWEIKKLRYIGKCQNGISKSSEYFGSGFPFISYGDVYNNEELPLNISGLAQSSEEDKIHYSVQEGDIFFTRTSETIDEIGFSSTCMETIPGATFSGFLIRFRPFQGKLYKGFSKFYFRSQIHRKYFVKEMNLVTRASLSQDLLKNLPIVFPPFDEQKVIALFLEDKMQFYSSTISKIIKEIELLQEYRTALISEVVTGKIKVM